jgi:hypothetical protein
METVMFPFQAIPHHTVLTHLRNHRGAAVGLRAEIQTVDFQIQNSSTDHTTATFRPLL